jgi:hypothetical protein
MKIIVKVSEGGRFAPVDYSTALDAAHQAIAGVEKRTSKGESWRNGTALIVQDVMTSIRRLPTGYSIHVWKYKSVWSNE